jgi:autotransporter-associated beta strand protein
LLDVQTSSPAVVSASLALGANTIFRNPNGSLTVSGPVNLNGNTLTAAVGGANAVYSGAFSGTGGSILKNGSGTLTMNGTNTYTGTTTVAAGSLNGTGSITGSTTVQAGATIRGGTGGATGFLTLGSMTVNSGGSIAASIAAPNTSSQLAVTGSNTLNLSLGSTLKLTAVPGFQNTARAIYTIATWTNGGNLIVNGVSVSDGDRIGYYENGLGASGPVVIDVSGLNFSLSQNDSFSLNRIGNNLVLTFSPVPEPATVLAVGAAGLGLAGFIRRRRFSPAVAA